eukprot:TRINITY_DN12438_c0_g1_i3.p3 TRINITY_DN12438_c0_g1~~TRINITY_DN12438_c0_g1_i3.p3  ORF type:complete len:189 (-),score=34.85 TRINITY_DN12438_c0_g1_i3:106-672(-)
MAGDILIRCKHFHSAQERFPVFRIMINTGFVFDNIVRYYKRDVDFSPGVSVSDQFFIDIIFTVVQDTSGASDVNLNQLVKQLDEQNEEIEKAKAESTIEKEKEMTDKDILDELLNDPGLQSQLKEVEEQADAATGATTISSKEKIAGIETLPEDKEKVSKLLQNISADQDLHVDEKEIDDYFIKLESK